MERTIVCLPVPTVGAVTHEKTSSKRSAFVTELAQHNLDESMRKVARGSKFLKFTGKPIKKKIYRFVTDHKF